MNYNLSEAEIDEVKSGYDSWDEIMDRAKELGAERKAVLDKTAGIFECKPGIISKLYKEMKKKCDEGESEVNDLTLMLETLKGE